VVISSLTRALPFIPPIDQGSAITADCEATERKGIHDVDQACSSPRGAGRLNLKVSRMARCEMTEWVDTQIRKSLCDVRAKKANFFKEKDVANVRITHSYTDPDSVGVAKREVQLSVISALL
jgi:hypothetical protein